MSVEEKSNVLADLLVKSAINQALEKQKEVGWVVLALDHQQFSTTLSLPRL